MLIYIYKNQLKRIKILEDTQQNCSINKLYTILEVLKTDIRWIKKTIEKKD